MARLLIIGSGPAAAGAALAASSGQHEIEIVDLGERLESDRQTLLDSVLELRPEQWAPEAMRTLSQQPVAAVAGELPQKRMFGSDFVFRDRGQLAAFSTVSGGNRHAVSAAFGGFSNVWGAQVMPFTRATIDAWPIGYDELVPHYRAVLDHIPFSGADDDYSELFPLLTHVDALPPLSPPAAVALARYQRRRAGVRRRGITMGAARLALNGPACVECGLCLTGCPWGLIYSSAQTIGTLQAAGRVTHTAEQLAVRVGQDEEGPWARVRDLASGALRTLRADHVLVACGAMGSTRLMLGSARPGVRHLEMEESVQIVLPFLSAGAQPDPRTYSTFTLNQFNMLVEYGRPGLDLAQFHLYPYNPAFEDALPGFIRAMPMLRRSILRRTVAALGYLPSWASPRIGVRAAGADEDHLPPVSTTQIANPQTGRALRSVFSRVLAAAPALDLWPGLPALAISGPAKSYHFGGSFPHVSGRPAAGGLQTDRLGRVAEWDRVHLIDGSVFPTVPATTFTLTVMANAHRIASEIAGRGGD